ncbi:PAS domain-containing protein, partial [uncultured Bosea sp.]|uniref:PAS domain-containing protein n=1 Tax=uncultured Bosea sp. TaxID=211457 RepID=UPI00345B5925
MTAMFADKGLGSRSTYLLDPIEVQALTVLPMPVLVIGEGHAVLYANTAAEDFFQSSAALLKRQRIDDLVAFGSPVLGLIEEVQRRGASVSEYRLDLGTPRLGTDHIVDVFASPLPSQGDAVVL